MPRPLPPETNLDGELTPWADEQLRRYAAALVRGDATAAAVIRRRTAPAGSILGDVMDDVDADDALRDRLAVRILAREGS